MKETELVSSLGFFKRRKHLMRLVFSGDTNISPRCHIVIAPIPRPWAGTVVEGAWQPVGNQVDTPSQPRATRILKRQHGGAKG